MMGRTHALTGVLTGLLAGRLVDLDTLTEVVPFAAVTAGYALLPDLDHPKATASRLLGPITRSLSFVLRQTSGWLYQRTKGPRDETGAGTHRHLSHTLLFALALGGITAASTAFGGPWVVVGWLALGLLLATASLGTGALLAFAAGTLTWLPAVASAASSWSGFGDAALTALAQSCGWLGLAVALGCFTHCLGDALTKSGCPFLFPLPIAGETWYELRPPKFLRFTTGKAVETWFVFPAVALGCLAALPGALDRASELLTQVSVITAAR